MRLTLADSFPSDADRDDLVSRRGSADGLGDADEFRWWAYHYGWRRVFLHAMHSSVDPWFDAHAVDQAEAMFRRRITRRREWISPADEAAARGDHDTAARLRVLDREREELAALIPVGGWDARCPEALAYVACCSRQARAAASTMADRTAMMRGDPEALSRVRDALGISATERKGCPHCCLDMRFDENRAVWYCPDPNCNKHWEGVPASEKAPQRRSERPVMGERDSGGQSVVDAPGDSVGLSLDDLDRRSGNGL